MFLFCAGVIPAQAFTWTPTAAGDYSWDDVSSNWTSGFPNAVDDMADISADIADDQTLFLNQAITTGSLVFNDTGASDDSNFSIQSGTGGSLVLQVSTGSATVTNSSGANTISAPVTLASNSVFDTASGTTLSVSGVIDGSGTLTKSTGTGTLVLGGANTYTGATTINTGVLKITNATALGSTAAGTTVLGGSTGSTLQIEGGITIAGESLTVASNGSGAGTALRSVSGDNSWTGVITLQHANSNKIQVDADTLTLGDIVTQGSSFRVAEFTGSGNSEVDGIISGPGGVTRSSGGTTFLNGLNTYTGATRVAGGTLSVNTLADSGTASSLGASGGVTLEGGTLRYTGTGHSTNRLFNLGGSSGTASKIDASGTGAMVFNGTGNIGYSVSGRNFTLKLGGTSTNANTLAGIIANNGLGVVSLTKENAGRWIISGANTYTGATTVTDGTLALGADNAFSAASAITLSGGMIDLQTFSASAASLGFAGGTTLKFNLGAPGNATALLALTGNLNKSGSGIYTLDFSGTGQAGTYNLISYAGTTFTSETDFTIANLGADLDALLSLDAGVLSLTLTSTAVPEPSTYAMVAGVLALGAVVAGRRRVRG